MYIGVDIGGTKCAVCESSGDGKILKKIKFATTTCEETIENICQAIEQMDSPQAIGISCGGPLDIGKGLILSPPNLVGWESVPIVKILEDRFHVSAYLQNDANACALAEWKFGAGRGYRNIVFFTFGTGLGCGLILDNRLYEGPSGTAGEVGHIRISDFGPVGYGKSGSFEGFCSGSGLAQIGRTMALEHLQRGETTSFCKSVAEFDQVTAKLIAECAEAGNEDAREVYRICARQLGRGLSIVVDILNPEVIILGSIYQRSEALLYEEMMKVLKQESLPQALEICKILPAELGDSIGDYAALSVAMNGSRINAKV